MGNGPIGSDSTRLIILRGDSGSGKSAVAAGVRAARPAGTVAIIGQDVIRREILGVSGDDGGHPIGFVDLAARYALGRGFDVIIEGGLRVGWYAETLTRLVTDHRGVSRCYVYDLSFEETVRRHATKPVAVVFGEGQMRMWWQGFEPIAGLDEDVITADDSLEATIGRVLEDCWPPVWR